MALKFKPQLIGNFGSGVIPDWHKLIKEPKDYLVSTKKDGNCILLENGISKGRSLKGSPSKRVQEMAKAFHKKYNIDGIVHGEFYAEGFTFPEIQHFYSTVDISSPSKINEYQNLWEKTNGGTETYQSVHKNRIVEKRWEFLGRDPEWLTTWHDELKFHIFDYFNGDQNLNKEDRYFAIDDIIEEDCDLALVIPQYEFKSVADIIEYCQYEISSGYEGLVISHKHSPYKFGRHTIKSGMVFKMKDDLNEWDAVILSVEEGTQIKEGVERTLNELGRSVTSGKQDDRKPNGKAKGFRVELENGKEMIVSLKGYTDGEKVALLVYADKYVGKTIRFTGMHPVKKNGVPRHAHFTKGNFRDSK
jgi:hypothetical protein